MPGSELQVLNLILQGGSFALVAWAVVYAVRVLVPEVIRTHDKTVKRFDDILERQEERHRDEIVRRDEAISRIAVELAAIAKALADVTDRLERVENGGSERA